MKILYYLLIVLGILTLQRSCGEDNDKVNGAIEKPIKHKEGKEKRNNNPDKTAIWTPEQAARHQKILSKLGAVSKTFNKNSAKTGYADSKLEGTWKVRGPKNMPGAFKFTEMLDGTDVIYGVTHNHYAGEYNSKSYIYKGTVYNPNTGLGGDDFEILTANWPNRYQNLFAFEVNGTERLIAHIENGPIYYSDNNGVTWSKSNGLPDTNTSAAINRQDNHTIYVTNNRSVYKSIDFGISFSRLEDFGNAKASFLYTPRHAIQSNANAVYLVRSGSFYKLNNSQTRFNLKGSYTSSHENNELSIGGDSRKLYVTESGRFWVSNNEGANWQEKFPKGNWYGDRTGKMSPGKFLAAHPENPDIVMAGYAQPVISKDGLNTTLSTTSGWGNYQNGTNLSASAYYNRIRFNYHPDFQASQFFYNSTGDLLVAHSSDGGIFISYKEWLDFPGEGIDFNNSGYANAHFININVLNTICPLIYRNAMFTGVNNPNHINYGTQDQGSSSIIPGASGEVLDFYQVIGGDGPSIDSYDGVNAWKWNREGEKVYAPVKVYRNNGRFQSIGAIDAQFNLQPSVTFNKDTDMGWVQIVIDHDQPDKRMWVLSKKLDRATVNGSNLEGYTVDKGTNQVAALAQGWVNPDKLFMLQDGKVFISTNRGTDFGLAINTPFSKTPGGWGRGDIGSGVVLPTNDNWILFCGPSNNMVGSILSKDGGTTWIDVTGDFPVDNDAQTGGMVATPDGKYVFTGTDIGPYVFDVTQEKWFSIAEGIGFFNAMDVDYIESINTVRFASWGSGILDFAIDKSTLSNNELKIESFAIYPNPVIETLFIKGIKNAHEFVVYDISGRQVVKHKTNEDTQIQVSQLKPGIYIVQDKNSNFTYKFVKK